MKTGTYAFNEKELLCNGKNKNAPSCKKLECSKKLYFNSLECMTISFLVVWDFYLFLAVVFREMFLNSKADQVDDHGHQKLESTLLPFSVTSTSFSNR